MKLPSLFRSPSPMKFDIKPRYYDPVQEELEQRTSQIKKELEEQGLLDKTDGTPRDFGSYGEGIRGAFAKPKRIKGSSGVKLFSSTAMIRSSIFLLLLGSIYGYMYLGPVVFEYMAYAVALVVAFYFLLRLKPKKKYE